MNLALFSAAFVLFFVTHGIADYWVQTDWQAQNKSKNPVALWRHVGSYTTCFVPAMWVLSQSTALPAWALVVALAAIGLPHAALDNRKLIGWFCETTKGWRRDNKVIVKEVYCFSGQCLELETRDLTPWEIAVRFHVTIALDQKAHFLCLALVAAALAAAV